MSDDLSSHANPQTRGTVPVQLFEAGACPVPPGTKATPRPPGRPRQLPTGSSSPTAFQQFVSEEASGPAAQQTGGREGHGE
jgi:hypothetical protein